MLRSADAGPSPAGISDPPRRVLVVDDNRDAADSLAALLSILGHDVSTAYGSQAAVDEAGTLQPDAITLDIGMPDDDGYTTARRLRALPGGERPLLVAVTGWDQQETRQLAVEAGFDYYLVKPPNPETLVVLLRLVRA
ncbi:MAG: response regulator [Gemmatimonadota bacterium]